MVEKKRDPFFDNAKFLLMVLVVFGHLLQPFIDQKGWYKDLYYTIYTFHMPAFIMISGFFAKSFDWKKGHQVVNSFRKCIIPYVLFQWVYSFFYWITGTNEHFSFQLHVPNWSLWFLLSSFFWQISLFFFHKWPPKVGIGVSLALSLLVGYIPAIGRELTLQRTVVFLPFFIIGYYLSRETVEKFEKSDVKKWFSLGFIVIFAILRLAYGINKYMFFGSKPYEDFLNLPEWGAIVRIMTLLFALVGMLAFFAIVPTKETWYTKCGQYTLTAYLLHGFFVKILRIGRISDWNLPTLGLVILLLLSIVLTYFLASEKLAAYFQKLSQRFKRSFYGRKKV